MFRLILIVFDFRFGKDDAKSSNVINGTLLEYIGKVFFQLKHFHNPFSFTYSSTFDFSSYLWFNIYLNSNSKCTLENI